MNSALFLAGILTILVGVIHSALGEILIFSRMRQGTLVPKVGNPILRERHVRILWATWHVVTIFGIGFAAILMYAALSESESTTMDFVLHATATAMCVSSALVCFATKGMHPGWIGLLVVAAFIWFA